MIHDFKSSSAVGGVGESLLHSLLSELGSVESADVKMQRDGIDFVLDGVFYEVKFDLRASTSGNLALETVSVKRGEEILKKGWIYTSKADCVCYLYLKNVDGRAYWSLYFFSTPELRSLAKRHPTKPIKNTSYESEVSLVPISELKHKANMLFPLVGPADLTILRRVHEYFKGVKYGNRPKD